MSDEGEIIRPDALWHCQQTLLRFYHFLDLYDVDGMLGELHADAVWMRHGRRIDGSEAIRAAMAGPPRVRTVRHVLTNIIVHPDGGHAARATALMLIFGAAPPADGEVAMLHPPGGLFSNESSYRWNGAS
jgi:hypothetical protein